ncbi:hypothetical protein L9G74_12335 [Shewanella sp. C32]|uniref:Uncharacterized protein n=1 Tax=Shewanella electrica TaxID=515560 RepID=A0ABT2FLL8_9GAMM|nr:hypothetical protein [Shewanella electrica]MCH1925882.1 hypothetical protein [Shewanella electrica]MCS4557233.1 hypothetical protein [Shewanella electrica]
MMRLLRQYHAVLTLLILIAALICYWLGARDSSQLLVVIGCSFEMVFWSRLVLKR